MTHNRKPGPTPKTKDQQRKNRVSIFMTDAEFSLVKAKAFGIPLPLYIRLQAVGGELPQIIPEANITAWRESANLQNNLNQLARKIAAEGFDTRNLKEARDLTAQLRRQLLTLDKGNNLQ